MRISDWSSDVCSSDLTVEQLELALWQVHCRLKLEIGRRYVPCDRLIPVDEQSKCGGLNAPKRDRSIAVIASTNVVVVRPFHTVHLIHLGSNSRGNIKRFFFLFVDPLLHGFVCMSVVFG